MRILFIFTLFLLWSCENKPNKHSCNGKLKVIDVQPHHATRVFVTYINSCGDTLIETEHCSATIKADNITFDVRDYLDGKLQYGPIK